MESELSIHLHHPLTEEEWDDLNDWEFDRTDRIFFKTKQGKTVEFRKIVFAKDICDTVPKHCEFKCSRCGEEIIEHWGGEFNYCPYCGADMRGGGQT